jgi:PAS domain S-box-containing protein
MRDQEVKWPEALDAIEEAIAIIDVENNILQANRCYAELVGIPKEKLIGRKCYEVVHCNIGSKSACPHVATLKTKRRASIEFKESNLGPGTYSITTFPVFGSRGKIKGIVHIIRDITERKKVERALRESEERYRDLFESSYDVIVLSDASNRIIDINPRGVELTGYARSELLRMDILRDLVFPVDREMIRKVLEQVANGEERIYEVRWRTKEGRIIWFEGASTASLSPHGKPVFRCTLRNITNRKKAEEIMKRRLMRYRLEDGNLYLVKEKLHSVSFEVFQELLMVGYEGVIISRNSEEELKQSIKGKFKFWWLAESGGINTVPPEIDELERRIKNFQSKKAIMIDRLDYLIFKAGFKETLSFIQKLREIALISGHIMLLSIDPLTLSGQEMMLLEKEVKEIELLRRRISQDLFECLRFIHSQDLRGLSTCYSDISLNLGLSRPTVRRRVLELVRAGYLKECKKGRKKLVELTELGRNLLLK